MAKRAYQKRGPYKKRPTLDAIVEEPTTPPAHGGRQHSEVRSLVLETRMRLQALLIVDEMLTERALARAQAAAPRKLLMAANQRESLRSEQAMPRQRGKGRVKNSARKSPTPKGPEESTLRLGQENPSGIGGTRLTLFLLEHLHHTQSHTIHDLVHALRHAGFTISNHRQLVPSIANITMSGRAKRDAKTHSYTLTAKGQREAKILRQRLEERSWVIPAGYRIPPQTVRQTNAHAN